MANKSSSGGLRASQFYRPGEWLGRAAQSGWALPAASLRRRGLRRRMSAALIVAALGPVLAVSVVAVMLIFSSVEQGIEFGDRDHWSSDSAVTFYDVAGTVVNSGCASAIAERMQ